MKFHFKLSPFLAHYDSLICHFQVVFLFRLALNENEKVFFCAREKSQRTFAYARKKNDEEEEANF